MWILGVSALTLGSIIIRDTLPYFLKFLDGGYPVIRVRLFVAHICGSLGVSAITIASFLVQDMLPCFSYVLRQGETQILVCDCLSVMDV